MKKAILPLLVILFLFSACSGARGPAPTLTPTLAPTVTSTATETSTPVPPTDTPTPTPLPPIPEDYYHLHFEYRVTSDWADLDFTNPEILATIKVGEVTGNPQDISITAGHIHVFRPVSDLSKNPVVFISFDAAILPKNISAPLGIISQHGGLKGSGLKAWLVPESGDPILLKDLNHYWGNNTDTNSWKTQIPLEKLADQLPIHAELPRTIESPKMAWAIYYGWYMPIYSWMWWANPKWTDRPVQEYDSSDLKAIQKQIEQAQSGGLDGFIYATSSYYEPPLRKNFDTMLELADKTGFKILSLIDLDLINDNRFGDLKSIVLQNLLAYFSDEYNHSSYMKIDGKPVVVLYDTYHLTSEDWKDILNQLEARGYNGIYLSNSGLQDLNLFQGFYYYGITDLTDVRSTFLATSSSIRYFDLLSDEPEGKIWVATVSPGFDNTPLSNDEVTPFYGKPPTIRDRADGGYYTAAWNAAIDSNPMWVFITSWNEWQENTNIEPSQYFGSKYLEMTMEYIDQWKHK